jgi:hypothetical protein
MPSSPSAIALVLLGIFSSFGAAQERADGPPSPPSESVYKTTERKITLIYDPHFPISSHALNEIIQSKELASAAIGELTGARVNLRAINDGGRLQGVEGTTGWGPEKSDKWYLSFVQQRQQLVGGETRGTFPFRLLVAGTDAVGESELEKYADLVVKHLNIVLADLSRRAFESKRAELNLAKEQAQKSVELAGLKLDKTRESVRRASGDFSETALQELLTSLRKQQQALEVELAGMKGRAEAIQREVAKTAERAKNDSADDEIITNLMRVIELRTQQLRYLKELGELGTITQAEAAKAEEQVALAKVELAQAKRANSRPASEQLDKLNTELAQIAISMAESEAKLKYVTEQLAIHADKLKHAAYAQPFREQLDKEIAAFVTLQAQANHAATEVTQLESSFRPARVEAFELRTGEDKPEEAGKRERK